MFPILITQFYGNLIIARASPPPQSQFHFLNEWGENFEFGFCKNIEDKFNGNMPFITDFAVFHAYLKRS